jgi:hypothetical protein
MATSMQMFGLLACCALADSALVVGLVSALTESLRLLGVGKQEYERVLSESKVRKQDDAGKEFAGLTCCISSACVALPNGEQLASHTLCKAVVGRPICQREF